jgi:transcription initiation factor TFIID subunit 4
MQSQTQRNKQGNANQHSLSSQASTQQSPASGSAKLPDQQVRMPTPTNQGHKSQASSSPQTFVPLSGTQMHNSVHYFSHENSIQTPDAKGVHAMPNRPPSMNPPTPLQTSKKQLQPTKIQQVSQHLYGTNNTPQSYPRPTSGSMPLRPQSLASETRPPLHSHGMVPAIGTTPTHPTMQQSAGKARQVGTGGPSAKSHGKQVICPPACRFPNLTAI